MFALENGVDGGLMAVYLGGVLRGRWVLKAWGLGVSRSGFSFIGSLSCRSLVTVQVAESP